MLILNDDESITLDETEGFDHEKYLKLIDAGKYAEAEKYKKDSRKAYNKKRKEQQKKFEKAYKG